MKQYEYWAKDMLRRFGVATAPGRLVATAEQAAEAVADLGPAVLKAQVLTGGRGRAGGIRFADTPEQALGEARRMLGMDLKGYRVDRLYVEARLDIRQELYLSVAMDRNRACPLVMASSVGGMDIETVDDDRIVRRWINPRIGAMPYLGREMAHQLGLAGQVGQEFAALVVTLYNVFRGLDAELVEINPLAVVDGGLVAADARLNIDDSAVFRHADVPVVREGTPFELRVRDIGLAYVDLDGDIAVMANGAGMAMATIDAISYFGGRPANFLDAGGGAAVEPMAEALDALVSRRPRVIFINIFGGITRCDEVAEAVITVIDRHPDPLPLVVRLAGTRDREGVALLAERGLVAYSDMATAARQAVALSKGGD